MASDRPEGEEERREVEDVIEEVEEGSETDGLGSPELMIKHPLQNAWTLWFFKNDKTKQWEENQREIITFTTVEDFWALYNHIELASRLAAGCDYSLFKEGIKPMWEDERNKKGGRWLINLDKKQRASCLDNFWLEVMLCLIGESFDGESVLVNGAVVNVRNRGDKISMWLCEAKPQEAIVKIGQTLKKRLGIDDKVVLLGFECHNDTINKTGSTAKSRYQV
jgi:translation initiation factor 4E